MTATSLVRKVQSIHRLSNGKLAQKLGVCSQSVQNWRSGRTSPTANTRLKLVRMLQPDEKPALKAPEAPKVPPSPVAPGWSRVEVPEVPVSIHYKVEEKNGSLRDLLDLLPKLSATDQARLVSLGKALL